MNEEHGPPIGGLDSLVFSSCIIIFFTIILIAYVTNSVAALSAKFLSLLLLNYFRLVLTLSNYKNVNYYYYYHYYYRSLGKCNRTGKLVDWSHRVRILT